VRDNTHKQSTIAVIIHAAAVSFCELAGENRLSSTPMAARTMTMAANVVRRGVWVRMVFE
jgi:hypothetical protein